MTPMTLDERNTALIALGPGNPAAPELVLTTAKRLDGVLATRLGSGLRHELAAIIRRGLYAEAELATTRATVARIAHAAGEGDDYSLSDLVWELERAGVGIERELADIDDSRTAEYEAQARS